MKLSIFWKTTGICLIAILIFLVVIATISGVGFKRSLSKLENTEYEKLKINIKQTITELIKKDMLYSNEAEKTIISNLLVNNITIFIKSKTDQKIFSKNPILHNDSNSNLSYFGSLLNSKQYDKKDIMKISINKKKYSILIHKPKNNKTGFYTNFYNEVINSVRLGIIISITLAIIFIYFLTSNMQHEAKKIVHGIEEFKKGNLHYKIPKVSTDEFFKISETAQNLAQKLEEEYFLRNQWTHDITHDLRTPITAMKTQLEAMIDGVLDKSTNRLKRNLKSVNSIEELVNDLALLMKLESPEMRIKSHNIYLKDLIIDINTQLKEIYNNKQIKFLIDYNIPPNYLFKGDPGLISRCLQNIIQNAYKYSIDKSLIKITINRSIDNPNRISFKIFNSGSYIPYKKIQKIFNRLYRIDLSRNTEGHGIGLSIAMRIAELHQGKITAKSSKNKGTTFQIELLSQEIT